MLEPNVCAIVVTFNPDRKLRERVQSLASQVGLVIVVDNASGIETKSDVHKLKEIENLVLIQNSTNLGLGAGFNIGLRHGLELGYQFLGIFDQDSMCPSGLISELLSIHLALCTEPIALVSPTYRDESLGFTVYPDTMSNTKDLLSGRAIDVMSTFSSASLIRSDALTKIGFMNEKYFIDYIDHEYCLRCQLAGYRILQSRYAILEHRLGSPFKTWIGITILSHSSSRIYYQFRNRIFLYRKFFRHFPRFIFRDFLSSFARIFEILMYESNKSAKFWSMLRGIYDAMQNKSGVQT